MHPAKSTVACGPACYCRPQLCVPSSYQEQPFRTGQLCFQARRLFNPPSVHKSVPANVTPGNGPSDAITESAIPGESTPQELKQIFYRFTIHQNNEMSIIPFLFFFSSLFLFFSQPYLLGEYGGFHTRYHCLCSVASLVRRGTRMGLTGSR